MIAPNRVHLMIEAASSVVEAFGRGKKEAAQRLRGRAARRRCRRRCRKEQGVDVKHAGDQHQGEAGHDEVLIGSTPSTWRASSSSRILRAPRSAVIAVPATRRPRRRSRTVRTRESRPEQKKPPRRSRAPKSEREVGCLGAPGAEAKGDTGDQHQGTSKAEGRRGTGR